jgi:hypothetical protein
LDDGVERNDEHDQHVAGCLGAGPTDIYVAQADVSVGAVLHSVGDGRWVRQDQGFFCSMRSSMFR